MRFRQSLFWDTKPSAINSKKHARYIIERIMDFGNDREVRWMWKTYPRAKLREVSKSRVLRPETRSLWQILSRNKKK